MFILTHTLRGSKTQRMVRNKQTLDRGTALDVKGMRQKSRKSAMLFKKKKKRQGAECLNNVLAVIPFSFNSLNSSTLLYMN